MQGELEDAPLLYKAEFVLAGKPPNPHQHEAFRKRGPALELGQRHLAVLYKILPNPPCRLANLGVHRVLLPTTREVP